MIGFTDLYSGIDKYQTGLGQFWHANLHRQTE